MFSVSVAVYHKTEDIAISEKVATTIMVLMEKEAPRYKAKLKLLAKESTHKLVQNPYITYYRTAENLLELSKLLDKPIKIRDSERSPSVEPIVDDLQEYFIFWDKRNDVYRSAFLMYLASFEGFLNILYELYTRTDLRSSRLFERISREQVDVKLRMAPVYCDGFKVRIIDHEDKRFKNFLRLVNLRNDYVHANLVKTHERYIIEEDDFTFIVENEEPGETPTDINQLDLSHIELAKLYIDELVDMVIESLDPKTKREFKNFIFNEEIEVESFEGYLIPK